MADEKIVGVVWTEPALADLDAIADYIDVDNPSAAARLVRRVFTAAVRISSFPQSGRRVPELRDLPYREIVVTPCRIIYRIERGQAFIVLVIRGEQLLEEHRLWR